jgi:hypothetical protein
VRDLGWVETERALKSVAVFGSLNMMDLLYGFPDVDKPMGGLEGERLRKLQACFGAATVVEEMLISLLHISVDVCFLRRSKNRQYQGFTCFKKHIIASPQGLSEVKQLFHFLTSLEINGVVDVSLPSASSSEPSLLRARIVDICEGGFMVVLSTGIGLVQVAFS